MKVKVFLDGANLDDIIKYSNNKQVSGFTTNPTLMSRAGVVDYKNFAQHAISMVNGKSLSLEVFSDELNEMEEQAEKISKWGAENVYVKIPITNTKGISTGPIIKNLSDKGVHVNVTAIFTKEQIDIAIDSLSSDVESIISIFAGRIANTGINPVPMIKYAKDSVKSKSKLSKILWASTRESYNIIEADNCGCDIITLTSDLVDSMALFGKNLEEYSLETVQMFYDDALKSNFKI
jgi:transaldolase